MADMKILGETPGKPDENPDREGGSNLTIMNPPPPQEEPAPTDLMGMVQKGAEWVQDAGTAAIDYVTGGDAPKYPDLRVWLNEQTRAQGPGGDLGGHIKQLVALDLGADPATQIMTLKQQHPDLRFHREPKSGRVLVDTPEGGTYYIDAPGFSRQDISELATTAMTAGPVGGLVGKTMSKPFRQGFAKWLASTIGGTTAEELTRSGIVKVFTGGNGMDFSQVADANKMALALSGAGNLIAKNKWTRFIAEVVKSRGQAKFQITPELKQAALEANVDINGLDDATMARIYDHAATTDDLAAAIRLAKAEGVEEVIPLRRSQATQNVRQAHLEDTAAKEGAFTVRQHQREVQQQIEKNIELQRARINSTRPDLPPKAQEEQAKNFATWLVEAADDAKLRGDAMYKRARSLADRHGWPTVDMPNVVGLRSGIHTQLKQKGFTPDDLAPIQPYLKRLDDAIAASKTGKLSFKDIDELGRDLRAKIRELPEASSAEAAAVRANNIVKGWSRRIIDSGNVSGNLHVLEAMETASKMYSKYGRTFLDGSVVQNLTKRTGKGAARTLTVDPTEAVDVIFGKNALAGNKKGLLADLRRLKTVLPEDKWDDLREAAFNKLFFNQIDGQFSGAKLQTQLDNLTKSPIVMNTLFTKQEQMALRQLAYTSKLATAAPQTGAANMNPSGTAMQSAVQGILGDTILGKWYRAGLSRAAVKHPLPPRERAPIIQTPADVGTRDDEAPPGLLDRVAPR